MAKSPDEMRKSMEAGLLVRTGKPLEHWVKLVKASALEKHGLQVKLLKSEHGLGHGHANFVCQAARGRLDADGGDLLEGQYEGKESLRPIYKAIATYAQSLGADVSIDPRKTAVALRRSKNFAVITPATKSRVDLGINLKDDPGEGRLAEEKPGKMCTHLVRLESAGEVDAEVKAWLKEAYERG